MNRVCLLLGVLLLGLHAGAQVNSDRPGFTNSSSVLKTRSFQMEVGASVEWYGSRLTRATIQVPSTNLRYGLNPFVEARLTLPTVRLELATDRTQLDDLRLGFKSQLLRTDRVEIAAITEVYFLENAGTWVKTPIEPKFVLYLPMSFALGERWVLKSQLGYNDEENFDIMTASIVLNRQISAGTTAQVEYIVASWYSNLARAQFDEFHLFNFSTQHQLSEHFALDFTYGTTLGLNNDFSTAFEQTNISIGVAYNGFGRRKASN
jgi:hypothetical protein